MEEKKAVGFVKANVAQKTFFADDDAMLRKLKLHFKNSNKCFLF